ncbi:OsmC family protein [Dyella psychrodurans]|uniref:OsmC family peroxiredoxin n=1 Tax=Dyella psychrodurans TaxID=1927960 RepID=A0A370WWA6_9GAMM|nr:OsmC family protein [Dyella psychrodurans]RDS80380.1 OsmC family peroxiredoxin [Dyella psychrodurans]
MVQGIAEAVQRVRAVLQRQPQRGLQDDTPAFSHWQHGLRVVSRHPNGTQVLTDMPGELGGSGDQVTPGWLFRAGVASCLATCIAMNAAAEGIALTRLEVSVHSRTDTRGFFGMLDGNGDPVFAGPSDMQWRVRIDAHGVTSEQLRHLVERSHRSSPISCAVENALRIDLHIDANVA